MNIKNIASSGYLLIGHEKSQLSNNYALDLNNVKVFQNDGGYGQKIQETQTTFIKRSKYDCYEDNSMYFTNCINEFYVEQLKCNLPWAIKSNPDFKQCESKDELKQFRKFSADITLSNYTEMIKLMGCFKPNCLQTTWTFINEKKWVVEKDTMLLFAMTPTTKVIRRQEIKLADFSTFLADCGGYLGLFLGASLLSITDAIITYARRSLSFARKVLF